MTDSPPPELPSSDVVSDRLDSWKEIAGYLRRDVTTVQRWEKREGMPVHRHLHDKLGSVYAFRGELDVWARQRSPAASDALPPDSSSPPTDLAGPEVDAVVSSEGIAAAPMSDLAAPSLRKRPAVLWTWVVTGSLIAAAVISWRTWGADASVDNPLAGARFQALTDFGVVSQAAAISRDGRFVAFLSDRSGRNDVWMTQIGTGVFTNLTPGAEGERVNSAVRTVAFSPDGSLVTYWVSRFGAEGKADIGVWAVPFMGGPPRPYLEGAAEYDTRDDGRLVYHTSGEGDPTFVRGATEPPPGRQLLSAPKGTHIHFTVWSPDGAFVYFLQGLPSKPGVPGRMDVWRIPEGGGQAERLTHHDGPVSHPVFIDDRTLLYLANDPDGSGPRIQALDVERRITRPVSAGVESYTSLAASADGLRLVATVAREVGTLWRLPIESAPRDVPPAQRIALTTGNGSSPRLGDGYLLYVSSKGASDSIWKLQGDHATELWSAPDARVVGGPAIAGDGRRIVFSVRQNGRTRLHVANTDGTGARLVSGSFEPEGDPAWAPDGSAITVSSLVAGEPRLFSVSLATGTTVPMMSEYSVDPVWSPGGEFVVFTGADVGTTFSLKAVASDGQAFRIPSLTLTRGARRLVFLPGSRKLLVLRGTISHKNLWLIDLETGDERQLTRFAESIDISDFDVSPDGKEITIEQVEEQAEIVVIDLSRR